MTWISGETVPASTKVVLLVGTQKGLFRFLSDPERRTWQIEGPSIEGYEILHVWLDPRDHRRGYAAAYHVIWGTHVYRSDDAGRSWVSLSSIPCHAPGEYTQAVKSIWYLAPGSARQQDVLYAGIDPPGLFTSPDRGESWTPLLGLNRHPTRPTWERARGLFAVHSLAVDPRNEQRMYAAVSAGGAFRSDDGGERWRPINRGVRAENIPRPHPETGHNIHRLVMHPARSNRLYRQCYNGTYRSDDGGESWVEITEGLPSDFGYAIATAPHDPDTVFVIPEESSHMRAPVDGKLQVYRSRNAGNDWEPLDGGLPQQHAYVSVLREAMVADAFDPCGIYFGTSGGHLFASRNGGDHWDLVATYLPRILSVTVAVVPEV